MYQDYRVIDADGHVLEPVDLWERYIDPEFRHQAPRGVGVLGVDVLGHVLPDVPGGIPLEAPDYTTGPAARYGFAARRNFDAESQLEALDIEGIDVAVLYPSRGLYAASVDDLPPRFAAAICRAYNRWLAEFCARAPERLVGAAFVSLHDPDLAVAEAVHAVEQLGMRAVFARPNPVNGRTIDHADFDPLYAEIDGPGTKYVVDAFGDDLVVLGSDYPHGDGKFPHAIREFVGVATLSDRTKRKILWENPARLYGLERSAAVAGQAAG